MEENTFLARDRVRGDVVFQIEVPQSEDLKSILLNIDSNIIRILPSEDFWNSASFPMTFEVLKITFVSDLNIKDVSDGSYAKKATLLQNSGKVYFEKRDSSEVGYKITSGKDERYGLEFSLEGIQGVLSGIIGEKVSYTSNNDVLEAFYRVTPLGVKADYVLREKPESPSFPLEIEKSGDMDIVFNGDDQSWSYVDLGDYNKEYFRLPKPTITDAEGMEGEISFHLSESGTRGVYEIQKEFLETAAYPVTIDPTSIATVNPEGTQLVQSIDFVEGPFSTTDSSYVPS